MTEYITTIMYAYIGSPLAWTDIIGDVIGTIHGEWGIQGSTPVDRIADTGTLTFTLNNTTGKYVPGHASAQVGWHKGTPLVFYVAYDGEFFAKFYGQVESIDPDSGAYGKRTCRVTAVDWLDHAAELPLDNVALAQNLRGDQAITTILGEAGRYPSNAELDTGNTTFPVIFDTLDGHTRAYTELAKIANSELGYIYIRKDKLGGETLVFENSTHRSGLSPLSQIEVASVNAFGLLKEDGDLLLLETGDSLLLNELQDAVFDNSMMNLGTVYGQDLINKMKVEVYPKRTDTTAQILFSLDSPMQLAPSGVDITFEGYFTDPTGGDTRVTGINMIAPVITTDYKMWENDDGTGTDLTANLVITAAYKADRVVYTVRNNHASLSGYVTLLQARGYGIYSFNPISYVASNAASIAANGEYEATIPQKYQVDLAQGIVAGDTFLDEYKDPRTVINSMTCNANRTGRLMMSFLCLDVGDLIRVVETQTGTDKWAWIQNVSFDVLPGGVVYYTYGLKEHNSLASGGLRLVTLEPQLSTLGAAVLFGRLPRLENLNSRTYTTWMYKLNAGGYYFFSVPHSNSGGLIIGAIQGFATTQGACPAGKAQLYYRRLFTAPTTTQIYLFDILDPGINMIPLNEWCHFALTIDGNNPTAAPLVYVNGVASPLFEDSGVTTSPRPETGGAAVIGNKKGESEDYPSRFYGYLKDMRMYNRALTAAEILAMYNEGAGGIGVTSGLVFQAPCVYTSKEANYDNVIITADDKLLDNVYGAVGIPIPDIKTNLV